MAEFKKRTLIRIFLLPFLLFSFYLAKIPVEVIAIFAVFFILLIFFRKKIYDFIEHHLGKKFPYIHDWPGWKKKLLLVLVFILLLGIVKQLLFFAVEMVFGIDIDQMLLENLESLQNEGF
ncbi:hypothetical protein KKG83_02500 [Candidatus Micrarchaeota archaeon]|nr:hypothetical protein [Candidatus Micrarchaeota archaeon]MBU2476319.1 hypothetical protein [Candidatus Micrarchaeota archaeon]